MHVPDHADHDRHDPTLIAGHAAGDLPESHTAAVTRLLAGCSECTRLHADLVALAAATRILSAPAVRARDFRLTTEEADRLRRGSWLRGLLRPFAATRSSVRPMAAAFSSLGVAGLLVATLMPGLLASTASAPEKASGAGILAASAAPGDGPAGPAAAEASPNRDQQFGAEGSSGAPSSDGGGRGNVHGESAPPVAVGGQVPTEPTEDMALQHGDDETKRRLAGEPVSSPTVVLIASVGLLLIGLSLFVLQLAARRLR